MGRLDASLIARVTYARIAPEALKTDFVVVSRGADGSPHHGWVETNRKPPITDGFGAAFWDDGLLRHFGFYDGGACVASLDLHPPSERGVFQSGRAMRAGESYERGTVETLSPWSDNESARPTEQSFASWVLEHLEAVKKAGEG